MQNERSLDSINFLKMDRARFMKIPKIFPTRDPKSESKNPARGTRFSKRHARWPQLSHQMRSACNFRLPLARPLHMARANTVVRSLNYVLKTHHCFYHLRPDCFRGLRSE